MLQISQLFTYPIKSLPGIALNQAMVTDRGFEHDRRWMLVDEKNIFLTQRELPQMVFFELALLPQALLVTDRRDDSSISIPLIPSTISTDVVIWDDTCKALYVDDAVDAWFTARLGFACRLVYMPDDSRRLVDQKYAAEGDITSFSDGYAFLIIGQSSLDELNSRLTESLPMNRFRPNVVFTGGEAYLEDRMAHFTIAGIDFYGVKLCARCPVITTNQTDGTRGKEPLKTLASYRRSGNKVMFGQNLLYQGLGVLKVGDILTVNELTVEIVFE